MKVVYALEAFNLSVGSHADFSGSVFFNATVNGYNLDTEFTKLSTLSIDEEGETVISGRLRASNLQGITYDAIDNITYFNGNVIAPNITTLSNNLQGVTYDEEGETIINQSLRVNGDINGNKIGAPDIFAFNDVTPFIPIVGSDGIIEVGNRIDFHRATTEDDYSTCLINTSLNQLSIQGTNTGTYGNLELGGLIVRPSSTHTCRLIANTASNLLWFINAGVNHLVCDATGNTERWSTTRDNALLAATRTTGMTHTLAVVEPDPIPARTTFNHKI